MNSDPKENRLRRLAISIVSRLLACIVALSFLATLLPIGSVSATEATIMACCVGKTAGHCESGLASKKSAPQHDHNTIVADADNTDSHNASQHSAAESTAVRNPCPSDCCACSVSTVRQQNRDRGAAQAKLRFSTPLRILSKSDRQPSIFSSSEDWDQTSPRGPPAFLL
jgi:hypothetical protein